MTYGYIRVSTTRQNMERQVQLAFEQAEKELEDLRKRTRGRLCGVSRNTFYKYKRELAEE